MESILKLYQYKKIQCLIDEDSGPEDLMGGVKIKSKLGNLSGEIQSMEDQVLKQLTQLFNKQFTLDQ